MIRSCVTLFTLLLAVSVSTAGAETYSWTDEHGTVHFTEDLGAVPQNIRSKSRAVEENEPSPADNPASTEPSATTPENSPKAIPPAGTNDSGSDELYAGKTYAQWKNDLMEQEATMTSVRKRMDEIAAALHIDPDDWKKQKELLQEHNSLVNQYNGMRAHYFEQVEIARKAGLKINIQQ